MAVDIQFNVDQALAKLGELVAKHGPQAVDVAAQVVQVNAVGDLAGAAFAAIVSTAGAMIAIKAARRFGGSSAAWGAYGDALEKHNYPYTQNGGRLTPRPERPDGWHPIVIGGVGGVSGGLALISGINAVSVLLSAWTWVALFNPKLALAHQVLAKFAGL